MDPDEMVHIEESLVPTEGSGRFESWIVHENCDTILPVDECCGKDENRDVGEVGVSVGPGVVRAESEPLNHLVTRTPREIDLTR